MFPGCQSQTKQPQGLQLLDSACLHVTAAREEKNPSNFLLRELTLQYMFLNKLTPEQSDLFKPRIIFPKSSFYAKTRQKETSITVHPAPT